MGKFKTQKETDYLNKLPDFMVKWLEETVELKMGKRKEDSWITKGGLKVTSFGNKIHDTLFSEFDDTSLNVLYYIGFQNLFNFVPTIDLISNRFFKGDINKTFEKINSLLIACAIQFIEKALGDMTIK